MHTLYGSSQEQKQHATAIKNIAQQYQVQESLVRKIYEDDLKVLKPTANIKGYLSVLVSRHVIEQIRKGLSDSLQ